MGIPITKNLTLITKILTTGGSGLFFFLKLCNFNEKHNQDKMLMYEPSFI